MVFDISDGSISSQVPRLKMAYTSDFKFETFSSSMMSNLFAMRADLSSPEMKQWQNEYLQVRILQWKKAT